MSFQPSLITKDCCADLAKLRTEIPGVSHLRCSFLSGTGRNWLRGLRGTGFLYVAPAMLDSLELAMHGSCDACWWSADAYELRSDACRYETYKSAIGEGVSWAWPPRSTMCLQWALALFAAS